MGIFALVILVAAWFIGGALESSAVSIYLKEAYPEANSFQEVANGIYAALNSQGRTAGYVALGEATGYGGPMRMAVAVDLQGEVIGLAIIEHKETAFYLDRVLKTSFMEDLLGKKYDQPFELGNDVDGVTSATYSSTAIVNSVKEAARQVATSQLGLPLPPESTPKIVFGLPEVMLIALFGVGYLGRKRVIKKTKVLRWVTMLTGMVVLGFIYNRPLTLSRINMFLLGYFPEWQTSLYWYLLIGGIIFVFTADNRNPYCEWFCPFGAVQECMGALGGAKVRSPGKYRALLKWIQRILAWGAILIALLYRNPGVTSFEVFGTLFGFLGSNAQFILLGIVLVVSLFIRRPWCTYLCPLHPVDEFIRMIRRWVIRLWPIKKENH